MQISWANKFNMIFLFFILRKLILPFYSFTLFCIILPMSMFVPEATVPAWVMYYLVLMSLLKVVIPSPKSFHFLVPFILFDNIMSLTKFTAMISGLFQLRSSHEWVVTKKSGVQALPLDLASSETPLLNEVDEVKAAPVTVLEQGVSESGLDALKSHQQQAESKAVPRKKAIRLYRKELTLAFLLLTASGRSWILAPGIHFYFLLFQGVSFLVVGLGLIGEPVE